LLNGALMRTLGVVLFCSALAAACSARTTQDGASTSATEGLSGCDGKASSTIPASHEYVLTSFGNSPSDNGEMSCGEYTDDGDWYYSASRQRYGCGSHVSVQANGKCVVVETDDYGPDVCVEAAAGMAILDASPLVAEHLFGVSSAGWSDELKVLVTEVAASTPLGPCAATAPTPTPTPSPVVDAGAPTPAPTPTPTPVSEDAGAPPAPSGPPCSNDGACNPGDDGSGMICSTTSHTCIAGCHSDAQCPGDTTCQSGQCH
jgi:hypothetical protein